MRLTRIKLSGFKSFVDPTTFQLPGQLIGIVGPNGCGKSNLIDAVRWVMGESSARQLRGESMADVIFNGSTARKPVGQASIELVFDNSQGRLGGEYARYSEIAIRRLLSRDGQSTYFLNGTRCRRRDITDIFLGTGLGPRSYAIIEQGMISRVIEAGPEQLRAFLEEAAGISKYKERRRETENRIRHTRENLDRVNDLREEIEKQIERLQRQARNAERFKALKQEERSYRAGLLAMRWRNENAALASLEREVAAAENEAQRITSEQRAIEARLEQSRETLNTANDDLSQVQARFYTVGSEAARVEQAIRHQRELRQRRHDDLQRAETALGELRSHMHLDRAQIESISQFLDEHTPRLETFRSEEASAGIALGDAESELDSWRQQWEDAQTGLAEPQRAVEVERTRIDYHERQLMQLQERVERIVSEQRQAAHASSESTLPELEQSERRIADDLSSAESEVADLTRTLDGVRERARETAQALDAARERSQRMQGRLSSLKTLQEAALRVDDGDVRAWLDANGLAASPRLGSELEVIDGWESGVEAALEGRLDAVCVATLGAPAMALSELDMGELTLVQMSPRPTVGLGPDELLTKVDGGAVPIGLLAGVRCRETVDEALSDQRDLAAGEVFVTRDGTLVGRDWVRMRRGEDGGDGVLARGNEIDALETELANEERSVRALDAERDRLRAESEQTERTRNERQAHLNALHRSLSEVRTELGTRRSQLEQQALRDSALASELTDTQAQIDAERDTLRIARDRLQQSVTELAAATRARESLEGRRAVLHDSAEQARRRAHDLARQANEVALQVESKRSALESLTRSVDRQEEQVAELTAREGVLRAQVGEGDAPLASLEAQLEDLLGDRATVERELQAARATVHECDGRLRAVDRERLQAEQGAQSARQALEQRRLAANEAQVRRQAVEEQMTEAGLKPEQVLAELPEDAELEAWHAELQRIETRIQRLGPINLAAIDEFREQSERKRYLDAQHADLTEALDTLENAIAKIDRETRGRFKETYDRVNDGLAELFPRLFGGGHAFLELAGDDLLSAGVSIMARPPGKRISNIHLLSGGEKALTAVALVFTIFQLNPAPFCMLDEVDAPLDEANVGRYCELVREMSEKVQFIVITHNKTTMEGVGQLVGVTMHEPGCSRLVSVDVEEAARLAAV